MMMAAQCCGTISAILAVQRDALVFAVESARKGKRERESERERET